MVAIKPILVLQHMPAEHRGYLFDLLTADGLPFRAVRLDLGEAIPDLGGFGALWVLGGPMDVWQETEHPWLIEEKRAIREAVLARNMPYFGICLGHQLLADALGGEVAKAVLPEIGVVEISLSAAGAAHPLLAGLPSALPLLQWHLAEIRKPPPGASILASSPACRIHGMALGEHAIGLQSHVEISLATIREWLASPSARAQLEDHQGEGALAAFEAKVAAHMTAFNRTTRHLYDRLTEVLRGAMRGFG